MNRLLLLVAFMASLVASDLFVPGEGLPTLADLKLTIQDLDSMAMGSSIVSKDDNDNTAVCDTSIDGEHRGGHLAAKRCQAYLSFLNQTVCTATSADGHGNQMCAFYPDNATMFNAVWGISFADDGGQNASQPCANVAKVVGDIMDKCTMTTGDTDNGDGQIVSGRDFVDNDQNMLVLVVAVHDK